MPKVSVIIPVYGVEKYIERCARSMFMQTLNDLEFIFVDDCTKDNSMSILNAIINDYPHRKTQIKIIHHDKNLGLPYARKTGVTVAEGDFIIHCDSDDWVDTRMFELMYNSAVENKSDIAFSDFYRSNGANSLREKGLLSFNKESIIRDILIRNIPGCVWNKMVRRDLYFENPLIYPVNNMGEDTALMMQLISRGSSFSYVEEPLYYYYVSPSSMTNSTSLDAIYKHFYQSLENAELVFNAINPFIRSRQIQQSIVKFKYDIKYQITKVFTLDKKSYKLWRTTYPEISSQLFFNRYLTVFNKAQYYLTYIKSMI